MSRVVYRMLSPEEKYTKIVDGLKKFFKDAGFKKAVLGLSGGIDSALVACLAVDALGKKNVVGIMLPSYISSKDSERLARKLGKNIGIRVYLCPIGHTVGTIDMHIKLRFPFSLEGIPLENIQSRIRMVYLMAYANTTNSLLLDTGNRTENLTGYATLYGDLAGAVQPIGDLNKNEVYEVVDYINKKAGKKRIPQDMIDRVPSAELSVGQVDPFDYEVDAPLIDWIYDEGAVTKEMKNYHSAKKLERFRKMIEKSTFKRCQGPKSIPVRVVVRHEEEDGGFQDSVRIEEGNS